MSPRRKEFILHFWLSCPHCDYVRYDYFYPGEFPRYMTCEKCQRVTPWPAWRVVAYGNLGEKVEKQAGQPLLGEFTPPDKR